MKKQWLFIAAIAVCLLLFGGCASRNAQENTPGELCYVLCVEDDGIVVWIENIGNVYVKYEATEPEIGRLDTVVMEFDETDLKSAAGTFLTVDEDEQTYSYILENPKSIRLADPAKGEPTFG